MKKSEKKDKKPKIIKITPEQLLTLTTAIRNSNLGEELSEMMISMASGNQWLVQSLEKGQLTIQKLRKLFNSTTESFENRRKGRHHGLGTTQYAPLGTSSTEIDEQGIDVPNNNM